MSYNLGMTAAAMVRGMINVENSNAGLDADDFTMGNPTVIEGEVWDTGLALTGTGNYDGVVNIKYNRLQLPALVDSDPSAITETLTFTAGDLDVDSVLAGFNVRFGTVLANADIASITGVDEATWTAMEGGAEVTLTITVKPNNVAWSGVAEVIIAKPKADLGEVVTNTELDGLDANPAV